LNRHLLGHSQPCRTTTPRPPYLSERQESNLLFPVPKTGGLPFAFSPVLRVRVERTSLALQASAITGSAVGAVARGRARLLDLWSRLGRRARPWHPVSVTIRPSRFEGPATSPEVERGVRLRTHRLRWLGSIQPTTPFRAALASVLEPASGVEPPWSSLRVRCSPTRATPAFSV
jgi:hypothetical protein